MCGGVVGVLRFSSLWYCTFYHVSDAVDPVRLIFSHFVFSVCRSLENRLFTENFGEREFAIYALNHAGLTLRKIQTVPTVLYNTYHTQHRHTSTQTTRPLGYTDAPALFLENNLPPS